MEAQDPGGLERRGGGQAKETEVQAVSEEETRC